MDIENINISLAEFKLLARVLLDRWTDYVGFPAVYAFAHPKDDEDSVLSAVLDLMRGGIVERIAICGGDEFLGYPGFENWYKYFASQVEEGKIIGIQMSDPKVLNTLSEAEALVRFAKESGWKAILITAPPYHQLRAFITTVSVALRVYPELIIFSKPGKVFDWNEKVTHSQGILRGTRLELLMPELLRIKKYHTKGDLISPEEVLAYMDKRDKLEFGV